MMATEGDVAIVTGAAQGIGKCITKCLLSEGYQVGTTQIVCITVCGTIML